MSYGFNISLGAVLPGFSSAAAAAATSSVGVLVVLVRRREAALVLSLATGVSLQPQSHLDPCILNEKQKPCNLFYIWSYRLRSSIFILPAPILLLG